MKKSIVLGALVAILVLGIAASSFAASQTIIGAPVLGKYTAAGTVFVNASVNPKVELTLSEDIMNAGALDPDVAGPQWTGAVTVATKSNVPCTLSTVIGGSVNGANQPAFTSSMAAAAAETNLRGVTTRNDAYGMTVNYNTNPGTYQADVTYTLVQQ